MADTVRYVLEEMVPELEDLEKRGYFTKTELRSVVKKRTEFEYRLKRRAADLTDFIRYIEYEVALESLRKVRYKLMGTQGKRSLADYCINRRIHFIFERATRKFRGDLGLWVKWLDFCTRSRSSRQTSRVLAKALKLHPTVPGLWSRAAAWEFDHKHDASAARKLMQRGLRMCPDSQELWVEYFRFELLYAAKLRARRAVLGLDGSGLQESADTDGEAPETDDGMDLLEAAGEEQQAAADALLRGAVALAVLRKAAAAFPGELSLRCKLLKVLDGFDEFEGKDELLQELQAGIEREFGQDAQGWDALARRSEGEDAGSARDLKSRVSAATDVYERAVTATPSSDTYSLYISFLHEKLGQAQASLEGGAEGSEAATQLAPQLAEDALTLHNRSDESSMATEASRLQWSQLARRCGLPCEWLRAGSAGNGDGIRSAALWGERLALAACAEHVHVEEWESVFQQDGTARASLQNLVHEALQAVEKDAATGMWLHAIELLASVGSTKALARLLGRLELQLTDMSKGPLRGGMGAVAAAAVQVTHRLAGLPASRKLCQRLLAIPPPGGTFFHTILDIELGEAAATTAAGSAPGLLAEQQDAQVKNLFEAAVEAYGRDDSELWLRYVAWEFSRGGQGRKEGGLYWRAVKALAEPSRFIAAHQAASFLAGGADK